VGRFAPNGAVMDPNILEALMAQQGFRMQPRGPGVLWGGPGVGLGDDVMGIPPNATPQNMTDLPMTVPMQPRSRQDLSGAVNGTIMGQHGGVQQLGAAAQRRLSPPGPANMPVPPGLNPVDGTSLGPVSSTGDGPGTNLGGWRPPVPGSPGDPNTYYRDAQGNITGGTQIGWNPSAGAGMPPTGPNLGGDPRLMEIIDRVRMNPVAPPMGATTRRVVPPGVMSRPGAGPGIAGTAAPAPGGPMKPAAPAAPLPEPAAGTPMAKPPMVAAAPMEKPVSPQGPAFDDMVGRLRSSGIAGMSDAERLRMRKGQV
jgi:hypothetical protein